MKNRAVAFRYARALSQTLASDEEFERVATELERVSALLRADRELRVVLQAPSVSRSRRASILRELSSAARLSDKTTRLLELLEGHDRIGLLEELLEAFRAIRDSRMGIVEAEVTTAVGMDEGMARRWEEALARITGRKVRLNRKTDPSILGGAIARIASVVYDGSLRSQMEDMRRKLSGA